MKKTFTTLALVSAFGIAANAQVELSINNVLLPENGATYANLATGDTLWMAVEMKNNGTTGIVATDTIYMQVNGFILGSDGGTYNVTWSGGGYVIGAGQVDTFIMATTQGYNWGAGTGGEIVTTSVATDAEQTFSFVLYSRDSEGNLIIESDFVEAEEGSYNVGENNMMEITATYGTVDTGTGEPPASILNNSNATNINVYPNPTKDVLNFSFDFAKASAVTANVYDVTGRMVASEQFGMQNTGTQNFTLNVANLPNGNYTLEIATDNNKGASKFVINK